MSFLRALVISCMCVAGLPIAASAAEPLLMASVTYVNTKGDRIEAPKVCAPEVQLDAKTIRVYERTREDIQLFADHLRANGASKEEVEGAFTLAQTSYTCDRKSSRECSDGTCASGTSCKLVSSGNSSYCRCL